MPGPGPAAGLLPERNQALAPLRRRRLSVRTVEDHKAQLLHALGVETTADLVKLAVRQGLVSS